MSDDTIFYNQVDGVVSEVTATKRIGVSGPSLTLRMTEELRMLGLDYGDLVQVTIRRAG